MTSSMLVTVVVPSLDVGGCEMYAADMAMELNQLAPVRLVCHSNIERRIRTLATSVELIDLPGTHTDLKFADALSAALSSSMPDRLLVVVSLPIPEEGTTPDPIDVLEVADALGLPTTVIFQLCHRMFETSGRTRAIADRLTQTQRWVTVSDDNRRHLATTFGVTAERIAVVPNGVALPEQRPDGPAGGIRLSLGLPADAWVVLNVGRLVASKRQIDVVDAMSLLPDDVHLLVAGEGSEGPLLMERAIHLGVEARVTLLGHREDIPELLRAADVFVFPSIAEGASFALMEAMAAGLPVVAARFGSNAEIVRDGVDGYLHRPLSAEDVAEKLLRVRDSDAAVSLGLAARRRIERSYERGRMVRDTAGLVLGHGRPAPGGRR